MLFINFITLLKLKKMSLIHRRKSAIFNNP